MYPIVEDSDSILKHPNDFGQKTTRLLYEECRAHGLPVYGVSAQTLARMFGATLTPENLKHLASEISTHMQTPFIIRSSGLQEDSSAHAHAGQFISAVVHTKDDTLTAVTEVLTDAYEKLHDVSTFSLLLQPYIEPQYTGVFFTRDPKEGLLSVIAWAKGATPHVVSGGASTEHSFHRNHGGTLPHAWMSTITDVGYAVEKKSQAPQDVEWIYDGTRVYIVQTRPITTLKSELYGIFKTLEQSAHDHFFLERSGAAENYPHPVPLTYALISYLYRADGPIHMVYKKYGMNTGSNALFRIIHGHLYVDKESELQAFYPSYSYFGGAALHAHWQTLRGTWTTFSNKIALARVAIDIPARDALYTELEIARTQCESAEPRSWSELSQLIDSWYAIVFSINLLSSVAESRMRVHLRNDDEMLPMLLSESHRVRHHGAIAKNPVGNSLATEDSTPFTSIARSGVPHQDATEWLSTLPASRVESLNVLLTASRDLQDLREQGRRVSAWCAHHTRMYAEHVTEQSGIPKDYALYLSLAEVESGHAASNAVKVRAEIHARESAISLPPILSTLSAQRHNDARIISHGKARGYVIDETHITQMSPEGTYILYTDTLRPDLVQYFPRVSGIISGTGSTLSHLAIMAREAGIPVIVDPSRTLLTDGSYMMEFDTKTYT